MTDDTTPRASDAAPVPYVPHVGDARPYVRDIILGVNDGLVSTFLLVMGVVGGGLSANQVFLASVAAAIAGAISMGAGEFLATRSQQEVMDREIALEKQHIQHHREQEVSQLREMFTDLGIPEHELASVVEIFSRDDETLLNAMKVLEFGIVDTEERSPYRAMAMSTVLFAAGSLTSVVPFAFTDSNGLALTVAAILTAIGLFAVGAAKTAITNTRLLSSGLQNLSIAGVGGVIAFAVGKLVEGTIS